MRHILGVLIMAAIGSGTAEPAASAVQSPPVVKVCSLLPRAEVKRLIGGNQLFDMMAPEEEAVAGGSSCNYPGVLIQVIPFRQGLIDTVRKRGRLETVGGVGDEAYLYDNPAGYAELYVKVGARLLTLQRDVEAGPTGLWRTLRPVIDYERCNRCWWVCSGFCPDGAIRVTDGTPEIDYEHCKGCLVCLAQCPPHAVSAMPEAELREAMP